MKTINKRLLLLLLVVGFVGVVGAQSMRNKDTGIEYFLKVGKDLYEPNPKGGLTYRVTDGKLFVSLDMEFSDRQRGYTTKKDDITYYYDQDTDDIVGYSKETAGVTRYFRAISVKSKIQKDSHQATLYDGILSLDIGKEKPIDYLVGEGFTSEAIGFVLFYF